MALKDRLPGGTGTVPVPLRENETELAREIAAVHPGTLSSVAGELVLTTERLVFTPLGGRARVPTIEWALTPAKGKRKAPDVLTGVKVGARPALMRPPTLVLTTGDGTTWEIGVLAARRKPNRSRDNAVTRDRLVEAIRGRLTRG